MRSMHFIRLLVPGLVLVIGGCASDNMADLKRFVQEVKAREPGRIEPLPEIKQIETYVYEDAGRRDPFQPSAESTTESLPIASNGIAPDPLRRKEELEGFSLDSIRMVGTLEQQDTTWGLVKIQDGTIFRIKAGNYMGQNHGQITRISEEKIELTEIVPDGIGGYRERQASLALTE